VIPYGRQHISQEDIDAVVQVLTSDFLTQGPKVPEFEQVVARYCGASHAVAVNSATSALHIACLALGLGEGDWLWTSPITFVASANCGLYCNAQVDFVDIDPDTYNLCPVALERKLARAAENGCLPKVVVAVHLCGQPCDMAAIAVLAHKYGFKVIEDASHAIGGRYKGEPVGGCTYSDITVFSFHPVKIITTAEGGMAVTNEPALARQMEMLRSHGITRDPAQMTKAPDGPWYYQQIGLGFNYRLTDIQAALGLSQMAHMDEYVERRHALARRYEMLLDGLPLRLPFQAPQSYSGMHLYVIRLRREQIAVSHAQVFNSLRSQGIGVNLHYIPVYSQPYYQKLRTSYDEFPEAESYYAEAISLPMYYGLTEAQQDRVVEALKVALQP